MIIPLQGDHLFIPFVDAHFSTRKKIKLGKGIEIIETPKTFIERLEKDEKDHYRYRSSFDKMNIGLRITPSQSIFEGKRFSQDGIHDIGIVCSLIIRLATGIPIDFPFWFDYSKEDNIRSYGASLVRTYRTGPRYYYPIDTGKQFDGLKILIKHFDTLLKLFLEEKSNNRIVRAIEFASIGFQTFHIPTRLVNHVIFLETLFSNSNNEIAFQLASKIALYLHKKSEFTKKENTFKNVKEIYKLRSKVVHGNSLKDINKQLLDKVEELNTTVFNTILRNNDIDLFSLGNEALNKQFNKLSLGIPFKSEE